MSDIPPPPGTPPPPPPPGQPFDGGRPGVPPGYSANHSGLQPIYDHPDGTKVLILGVLGVSVCGLLAPFAWIMGRKARREMASRPDVVWSNEGTVTAGWICGIVGSVIILVALGILAVVVIIAASSGIS